MIALISCVMSKYTKISWLISTTIDPGNKSSNTTLLQENLNIVAIYSTLPVEIISTVRLLIDNNINTWIILKQIHVVGVYLPFLQWRGIHILVMRISLNLIFNIYSKKNPTSFFVELLSCFIWFFLSPCFFFQIHFVPGFKTQNLNFYV